MKKIITYLWLLSINFCFSQYQSELAILRHTQPTPNFDHFLYNGSQTSIELDGNWSKGYIGFAIPNGFFPLRIAPVINASASANNGFNTLLNSGVNLNASYSKYISFSTTITTALYSLDSLLNDYNYVERSNSIHFNPSFKDVDVRGNVQITPNRYFTISGGIDNYFIGNGDRSLLLDNKSKAYPFASLKTKSLPISKGRRRWNRKK